MSHQIRANLTDLKALASALKDLQWYTGAGGYRITQVDLDGGSAVWSLDPLPAEEPKAAKAPAAPVEKRRTVEPGDQVIVETKAQQMARRFDGAPEAGIEGVVFRVLTRGPHPRGMKVELRDRTVGRVMKNLTVPGAGEPGR
ncbi:MAG: DUF2196 domain-containing protein [Mycobacterium leprae]